MRTVETALWPLQTPTSFGEGVSIGLEDDPRLSELAEGEYVLLLEANEAQAEAVVHKVSLNGRLVWFGEFQGEIQMLYPDDREPSAQPASDDAANKDAQSAPS